MGDLSGCRGPVPVHRSGEHLQMGHRLRVEGDLVGERATIGRHGAIGDGGHRDAAGGDVLVKLYQPLGGHAALGAALVGGGLDEAVAQGERPDAQRGECG